jgi:hypothetical protein
MLWLDLNAMRLGTPTLDADEQRAQETGDGETEEPPRIQTLLRGPLHQSPNLITLSPVNTDSQVIVSPLHIPCGSP